MPVPKLKTCNLSEVMKSAKTNGNKEKDSHDSFDSLIRKTIAKDPQSPLSKAAGEGTVQWIQLLQALEQQGANQNLKSHKANVINPNEQSSENFNNGNGFCMNGVTNFAHSFKDLPGWPLLSPSKVQMQKCEKCSREFCSSINYRRHIRVHRKSLNINKDSIKNRDFLCSFWDKLSLEDTKEILSFQKVKLEEVAGFSIIRALSSFIRKPGFSSFPQDYLKAGSALLDVVQSRPARFPISSQELFSILDDASEKTFLCAGTALSLQKFVFNGEAGKIGMEPKNLIACTSFLVEQELVKAWVTNKDAEALIHQKQLVEEEEATQKRKAQLLKKKMARKLKQKGQKIEEQNDENRVDNVQDSTSEGSCSSPQALESVQMNPHSSVPIELLQESVEALNLRIDTDIGCHTGFGDSDTSPAPENVSPMNHRIRNSKGKLPNSRKFILKPKKSLNNNQSQQVQTSMLGIWQKNEGHKDMRVSTSPSNNKVWTPKSKPKERELLSNQSGQEDLNSEVLIGSISVSLGESNTSHQYNCTPKTFSSSTNHQFSKRNSSQEKSPRSDYIQNGNNCATMKSWKPVDRYEFEVSSAVNDENAIESCVSNLSGDDTTFNDAFPSGPILFSRHIAETFLANRWKEATSSEHVKLVLYSSSEPSDHTLDLGDETVGARPSSSERPITHSTQSSSENDMGNTKPKFRKKNEKTFKLKYIKKEDKQQQLWFPG